MSNFVELLFIHDEPCALRSHSGAAPGPDSAQQSVPGHHQQHGSAGLHLLRIPHAHHHMVRVLK